MADGLCGAGHLRRLRPLVDPHLHHQRGAAAARSRAAIRLWIAVRAAGRNTLVLQPESAVETEGDDEDAGGDFYLELEDGRVLFVSEGDLWNAEYSENYELRFPTREVILTRLPQADELLSLYAAGERLPVSESWGRFKWEPPDPIPPRGTFLPGPLSRYRSAHHEDDEEDFGA